MLKYSTGLETDEPFSDNNQQKEKANSWRKPGTVNVKNETEILLIVSPTY